MRYYIIAGEKSGDLHGGNLIKAIKKREKESVIRAWGGDDMEKAGAELVTHYKEMAFMGFWEVLLNARFLKKKIRECKNDILTFKPDAVVLIDYGGFNLRIAKYCKQHSIPVHYYIAPKVWAWNQKRAYKIKRDVDFLYCILPFEKEFFARFNLSADYVGNPLLDSVKAHKQSPKQEIAEENYIAVLPGSRKQEVQNMIENLREVCQSLSSTRFLVAKVEHLPNALYGGIEKLDNVQLIENKTYSILANATAAIVTSGTATLETALFEVPQVICYKTSPLSYEIGKRLIKVNYISLVNLILNKAAVTELIQGDFNGIRIIAELNKILPEGEKRQQLLADYKELKDILGDFNTSEQVAELLVKRTSKGA